MYNNIRTYIKKTTATIVAVIFLFNTVFAEVASGLSVQTPCAPLVNPAIQYYAKIDAKLFGILTQINGKGNIDDGRMEEFSASIDTLIDDIDKLIDEDGIRCKFDFSQEAGKHKEGDNWVIPFFFSKGDIHRKLEAVVAPNKTLLDVRTPSLKQLTAEKRDVVKEEDVTSETEENKPKEILKSRVKQDKDATPPSEERNSPGTNLPLIGIIGIGVAIGAFIYSASTGWSSQSVIGLLLSAGLTMMLGVMSESRSNTVKIYQLRYVPEKLAEELRQRNIQRDEIKPLQCTISKEDFSSDYQANTLNPREEIYEFMGLVIERYAVSLLKDQYGVDIDEEMVGRYLGYILEEASEKDMEAAAAKLKAMIQEDEEENPIILYAGNIEEDERGALSMVDVDSKKFAIDVGVFKCLYHPVYIASEFDEEDPNATMPSVPGPGDNDSRSAELLLATVISRQFLGSLAQDYTRKNPEYTTLTLNKMQSDYIEIISRQTEERRAFNKTLEKIDQGFSSIKEPSQVPFTSFYRLEDYKVKYGIPELINNRYRPLAVLGEGGMGVVILAYDEELKSTVAVKIATAEEDELLRRFDREATALASIHSSHVVSVRGRGEYETEGVTFHYYAMDYYPWPDLGHIMKHRSLTLKESVSIMIQALDGLEAIHDKQIVHRDLKPDNIMINPNLRELVITDLGIAKHMLPQATRLTMSGTIMGTPNYMSPEQANGDEDIDYRADVYSMGAMFYEMVMGKRLFEGTVNQILAKILTEEPQLPSEIKPDIDPYLEEIILKSVAKDPDDRYENAKEMKEALEEWLKEKPQAGKQKKRIVVRKSRQEKSIDKQEVKKGEKISPEKSAKPRKFRKLALGITIFSVIIVSLIGVFTYILKYNTKPPREKPGTELVGKNLGKVLSFENPNDHVDCGSGTTLDNIFDGGGSISFWAYRDDLEKIGVIIGKSADSGYQYDWNISSATHGVLIFKAKFNKRDGDWQLRYPFTTKMWHHFVIVYDSSSDTNNPTIYHNGALDSVLVKPSAPSGTVIDDSTGHFHIGERLHPGQPSRFPAVSKARDVIVSKTSFTPEEVKEIYKKGPGASLRLKEVMGRWILDGDAKDSSGNENHGELRGKDGKKPVWKDISTNAAAGLPLSMILMLVGMVQATWRTRKPGENTISSKAKQRAEPKPEEAVIENKNEELKEKNLEVEKEKAPPTSRDISAEIFKPSQEFLAKKGDSEDEFPEDISFTYNMLKPEEVAFSFRDKLLSILATRKVVLAFEQELGGTNSSNISEIIEVVEYLRKHSKLYKRFLDNLTIIETSSKKLPGEINKHMDKDTEVFMFARDIEGVKEDLSEIGPKVHSTYINENRYEWDMYYPLMEMVVLVLSQHINPKTLSDNTGLLEELNIASRVTLDGTIIFELLPSMERYSKQALIKKFAALKRALIAA